MNGSNDTFNMAAIQAAPVLFDRKRCADKACALIEEAAALGANIAAFGEAWLGGYPFWASSGLSELWWEASVEYMENAIRIPGPETMQLCETARRASIDVAIGVVELDERTQGTLYCTLLFIGRDGEILGAHRKLKPTAWERLVWGEGLNNSFEVHERAYGRVSGLNCWEHMMMMPGYRLAQQGTQIHVATWPGRELAEVSESDISWPRQLLLSRAFALQAGCYVIAVGGMRLSEHVPQRYRPLHQYDHTGDSCIIDPRGEVIAGPAAGERILLATGSRKKIMESKIVCDIAGHYSRPDIFGNAPPAAAVSSPDKQEAPQALLDAESGQAGGERAWPRSMGNSDAPGDILPR